jgi:hypothetical protein
MKFGVGMVAVLLLMASVGCRKNDEDKNPYPVWIMNIYVYEASDDPTNPLPNVTGNPRAEFHIEPSGEDTTVAPRPNTNRFYLWQHLDSTVTIEYYVHCENYQDSDRREATFNAENAVQGPGRDGPEVIKRDTVRLVPRP